MRQIGCFVCNNTNFPNTSSADSPPNSEHETAQTSVRRRTEQDSRRPSPRPISSRPIALPGFSDTFYEKPSNDHD
ncbi:hypothetical protein RSSM_01413 [Rhodopirellula sallentina SM41]|uniref:Uncharacterized protein n=1 Tax=Rhodopirellula sallentina SM41 TaxID=1263870 RepID=M5UH01_9BACT|nr:hypothetical protein RSSM_01413 [Rhodopirellula sallentina SM41]